MAADRQITVASTWAFNNDGVIDIQTKFKADPKSGGDTFCKYDPTDDVFLLDVGVGAEPLPGFTRLVTAFIDDEKNNDLMEKARVERIAVVVDPAEMAALDDEEEQKGALLDVGFEPDQSDVGTASAPPGFCEKSWVSESGGVGCFPNVSSDILRSLELLTATDISLEVDRIRITGSRVSNVDAAMERLTCLEKPFSMATSPPVENMVQEYSENDYRLQFQRYDNLPDHSIQQILVDSDAARIRERLFNANICLLLIFDSDIQRFIPMRNAPAPVGTGNLQHGRSKIWSGFQFREMGQPENNLEPLTTAAPEQQPAGIEVNADPQIEPPEVIDDHPYMSQEKATLVNNWVKGAAEVATDPDDLMALETGVQAHKEKEKPVEVKKVGGVKTRRAVASFMPIAPANAAPNTTAETAVSKTTNAPENVTGNISANAPANSAANTAPTTAPDAPAKALSNTTGNALSDTPVNKMTKAAPNTPVKEPPAQVAPRTIKKQGRLPSLNIPESKFINLAPPNIDIEKEAKEEPEPSPCTVVQTQESVSIDPSIPKNKNGLPRLLIPKSQLIDLTPEKAEDEKDVLQEVGDPPPVLKLQETMLVDPFTAPRLVYKESNAEDKSLPAPQWPDTFNYNAYGPPKNSGRASARGNAKGNGRGVGRGTGRGALKTPQMRPAEAMNPRGRTPGRSERVTYHRPSAPPRLIDASFTSVEIAKAGVEPLSFTQPELIPENTKSVTSASDSMSSSNPPPQTETREEIKEFILDTPVSEEIDTDMFENEKRLRDLKLSYERYQDQEQDLENSAKFMRSELQPRPSISSQQSRSDSQAINKTIYQKRLEELEKLRVKEKMQVVSEVESRDFHRTMGQKAPAPQKGKANGDREKREKRQAVLEEAWGIAPKKATEPKDEKTLEKEKAAKEQKEKAQKAAVDPLLTKLYPLLKPILSSALYYPGTLNLEIQFGLIIIPTLPGSYNGNMFEMKDFKSFFYPSHGLVAPSTMFIDRLTTSGSDIDYILGLKDGKGPKTIQFFEEIPSKREVIYEFHCKTKTTGMVVIAISDTGDTEVTRPGADLGFVNLHFPSQTWDARVVLSSKLEYLSGDNSELDRAIQVLVDKLYVIPNRSRVTMYTHTSDFNELDVVKVLVKRTTRHRYVFSAKKNDDGNAAANDTDTDALAADDDTTKPLQGPNEADELSPEEPGIFLQITEVQNLFFSALANDRNTYHCRARLPETMVNSHRLWYEVSIVSSAIEDMFLANKDLSPGDSATTWKESYILGKDAHIDPSHQQQRPEPQGAKEEADEAPHIQANTIGAACLGEMLRVATRVISRLDGVGYWNEGPLELRNFEDPIGHMLTTAGENILPAAVGVTTASGAVGVGPGPSGTSGVAGGPAKGPAAVGVEVPASESGARDMESASVRAGNPAFGSVGVDEFW